MQVGRGVGALLRAQVRGDMMMVPSAVNRLQTPPSARRKLRLLLMVAVLGAAAAPTGSTKSLLYPAAIPTVPLSFRPSAPLLGRTELLVFPVCGRAFKIPIRTASGGSRYSLNGRTL